MFGDTQTRATRDAETRAPRDAQARKLREAQTRATGARAWRRVAAVVLVFVYVVLWAGGVGHYLFVGAVAADDAWLASAFLATAGAFVLLTTRSGGDFKRLLAVAAAGLLVELCGAHTGVPFGRYAYTGVLRPSVLGVPLVMAFAWMTLVAYLKATLSGLNLSHWTCALVAAVWMTAIDLVIDPLAANQLGYWRWTERGAYYGIPPGNFAGWFAASFVIFALLAGRRWRANTAHRLSGASIVLFFTLIAVSFRLWAAALFGLALTALDVLLYARHRRS